MSEAVELPRSRRFWALMLLAPPLRAMLAYALFALLHLGLGLPWPAAEAGFLGGLLETLGLMLFVAAVDLYALGRIYRIGFFKTHLLREQMKIGFLAPFVAILATVPGYLAVLKVASLYAVPQIASPASGGLLVLVALVVTALPFAQIATHGERKWTEHANDNVPEGWR